MTCSETLIQRHFTIHQTCYTGLQGSLVLVNEAISSCSSSMPVTFSFYFLGISMGVVMSHKAYMSSLMHLLFWRCFRSVMIQNTKHPTNCTCQCPSFESLETASLLTAPPQLTDQRLHDRFFFHLPNTTMSIIHFSTNPSNSP